MEQTLTHTKLTDGLKDWTPQEVFGLEDEMRGLLEHPGWELISKFIEQSRDRIHREIEQPRSLDQAEYARRAGYLAGLSLIARTPQQVIDKAERVRRELAEESARLRGEDD